MALAGDFRTLYHDIRQRARSILLHLGHHNLLIKNSKLLSDIINRLPPRTCIRETNSKGFATKSHVLFRSVPLFCNSIYVAAMA